MRPARKMSHFCAILLIGILCFLGNKATGQPLYEFNFQIEDEKAVGNVEYQIYSFLKGASRKVYTSDRIIRLNGAQADELHIHFDKLQFNSTHQNLALLITVKNTNGCAFDLYETFLMTTYDPTEVTIPIVAGSDNCTGSIEIGFKVSSETHAVQMLGRKSLIKEYVYTLAKKETVIEETETEEFQLWKQTQTQNTLTAYRKYQAEFPAGQYIKEAQSQIVKIEKVCNELYASAMRNNSEKELNRYIQTCSDHDQNKLMAAKQRVKKLTPQSTPDEQPSIDTIRRAPLSPQLAKPKNENAKYMLWGIVLLIVGIIGFVVNREMRK